MNDCPLCGSCIPSGVTRCPVCRLDLTGNVQAKPTVMGQLLDSINEVPPGVPIEAVPLEGAPPQAAFVEPAGPAAPAGGQPPPGPAAEFARAPTLVDSSPPAALPEAAKADFDTIPYRPVRRPPMALLCVMDDGRDDGEWVRIRTPNFVIGRTDGDLIIPHDSMMSSRHASLTRVQEKDRYRWYLTDLQSTNGTYLKIASTILKQGQELLIGSRRLRFEAVQSSPGPAGQPVKTQGWQSVSEAEMIPALVELTAQGEGHRFLMTKPENWIGRDPAQCSVVLTGDPLVSPRHARLYRDSAGRWILEKTKSLNGTWLRIDKIPLSGTAAFQLGEQRFLLRFV